MAQPERGQGASKNTQPQAVTNASRDCRRCHSFADNLVRPLVPTWGANPPLCSAHFGLILSMLYHIVFLEQVPHPQHPYLLYILDVYYDFFQAIRLNPCSQNISKGLFLYISLRFCICVLVQPLYQHRLIKEWVVAYLPAHQLWTLSLLIVFKCVEHNKDCYIFSIPWVCIFLYMWSFSFSFSVRRGKKYEIVLYVLACSLSLKRCLYSTKMADYGSRFLSPVIALKETLAILFEHY